MFKRSVVIGLASALSVAAAQSVEECNTAGNVVGAVLATVLVIVILLVIAYLLWKFYWKGRKGKHLVLVTDPEKGGDFAFDNPGFREGTPIGRSNEKEDHKLKWQNWTPLTGLTTYGKPRALDDSYVGQPLVNVVPLRSHDFTGLGFNICGNMRDGIFIKDVLHRGPASESGRIMPGDRIESIRISFRHMVFEDALTILSYASPYEVQLEVENGSSSRPATLLRTKRTSISPADRICHPFYRSQSISDLAQINKNGSRKWNSEQPVSMSDMGNGDISKPAIIETSPIEKLQKFGVRVLPASNETLRHTEPEKHQNVRNSAIENSHSGIATNNSRTNTLTKSNNSNAFDEIDLSYDSHNEMNIQNCDQTEVGSRKNTPSPGFKESNVKAILTKGFQNLKEKFQHAGLKTDKENDEEQSVRKTETKFESNDNVITVDSQSLINSEKQLDKMSNQDLVGHFNIPEEVEKAGMAARNNRRSVVEIERKRKDSYSGESSNEGDGTSTRKGKRKAPPPPQATSKLGDSVDTFISTEDEETRDSLSDKNQSLDSADTDSEEGEKSGTTIELNASHITVHHAPDSDSNRKAASLGDLSRLDSEQPIIVLERAVSLDLADGTPGGSKKRKAPLPPQGEEFSDDGGLPFCKEARMESNIKSRLKKSSDFGRLEDVVKYTGNFSDDDDTDQGISACSSPEISPNMVISTPLKPNFFVSDDFLSPLTVNTPTDKTGTELNSIHISSCSWDLNVQDEPFITAVNGNSTEDEDEIPPELPTSPIPTYITEIQVVTGKHNVDSGFENGEYRRENSQDVFPHELKEMSSFMSNLHRPLQDIEQKGVSTEVMITSPILSENQTTFIQDTLPIDGYHVSLSQPNSLDPILQHETGKSTIVPGTPLSFSSENMSDEQILAMKSSPEPLSLDNGQTKPQIIKPDRIRNNISVTSIKANSSSRIPIRATPEPSQRKTKKENFVSFSSLKMSPTSDKHQTNGSGESSVTQIVLDAHTSK